jgi:hypothetical protein
VRLLFGSVHIIAKENADVWIFASSVISAASSVPNGYEKSDTRKKRVSPAAEEKGRQTG